MTTIKPNVLKKLVDRLPKFLDKRPDGSPHTPANVSKNAASLWNIVADSENSNYFEQVVHFSKRCAAHVICDDAGKLDQAFLEAACNGYMPVKELTDSINNITDPDEKLAAEKELNEIKQVVRDTMKYVFLPNSPGNLTRSDVQTLTAARCAALILSDLEFNKKPVYTYSDFSEQEKEPLQGMIFNVTSTGTFLHDSFKRTNGRSLKEDLITYSRYTHPREFQPLNNTVVPEHLDAIHFPIRNLCFFKVKKYIFDKHPDIAKKLYPGQKNWLHESVYEALEEGIHAAQYGTKGYPAAVENIYRSRDGEYSFEPGTSTRQEKNSFIELDARTRVAALAEKTLAISDHIHQQEQQTQLG